MRSGIGITKHKRVCQVCGYSKPLKARPARKVSKYPCPVCGCFNTLVAVSRKSRDHLCLLTAYQREALLWAAKGKSVKQTRRILNRGSVAAVQDALNKARRKLGALNTTHAVHLADQRGLFE